MQILRKITLFALLLITFGLEAAEQQSVRSFQQIRDSGELRVGTTIFPPWVMRAKNGDLMGSEIDMAKKLSKDMGLKLKLSLYEWDQLIPALESGEIDIVIAGMAITPGRALRIKFSQSYGTSGVGMAANTLMTKEINSLQEMKQPDINIGVVKGTVSAAVGKKAFSGATFKVFTTEEAAKVALLKGKLHAVVTSNPGPRFLALKYPNTIDLPLSKPLLEFREAFAVNNQHGDFLYFLNSWVVARTADASINTIRTHWFENLSWQDQVQ